MSCKEIRKNGTQGDRVPDFLVGIGIVRPFGNGFRMLPAKIVIKHGYVPDNTQSIGHDSRLCGIAKMSVHVLLTNLTLKVGKNKPVIFVAKTRDFARICEEIKERG